LRFCQDTNLTASSPGRKEPT